MAAHANAKKDILQAIAQALKTSVPVPFPQNNAADQPLFAAPKDDDLALLFAETFAQLQGQFSFCLSLTEVVQQLDWMVQKRNMQKWFCNDETLRQKLVDAGWKHGWHPTLSDCHASITACESLVARTGSMVLSSMASGGRTPSVYAPVHVCIAYTQQLVYDVSDALHLLQQRYGQQLPSQISFASGPSRTADIEKTLVTGVHGPKEVFCFLLDEV